MKSIKTKSKKLLDQDINKASLGNMICVVSVNKIIASNWSEITNTLDRSNISSLNSSDLLTALTMKLESLYIKHIDLFTKQINDKAYASAKLTVKDILDCLKPVDMFITGMYVFNTNPLTLGIKNNSMMKQFHSIVKYYSIVEMELITILGKKG